MESSYKRRKSNEVETNSEIRETESNQAIKTRRRSSLVDELKRLHLDDPLHLPSFCDVAKPFGVGGFPSVCSGKIEFGKGTAFSFWFRCTCFDLHHGSSGGLISWDACRRGGDLQLPCL